MPNIAIQKRVAAIHDLSGFGRCSLSVIIPILSVMGIQVCAVPTAILSTHTGGFENLVFHDLTDYIQMSKQHYLNLGISFDCIYSGFLASEEQIQHCYSFFDAYKTSLKVVDPVMGDHGKPYKTCTPQLRAGMTHLVEVADIITPNLTEASMLLGERYPDYLTAMQARSWLSRLCEKVHISVITGVPMADGNYSNIGFDREQNGFWRVDFTQVPVKYPGTGDIFASVLVGGILKGDSLPIAMNRATNFVQTAVMTTYSYDAEPRNGVLLEKVLGNLTNNIVYNAFKKL